VDAAPIDLFKRDPVAFLLYADLYEKPRAQVSVAEVRQITRAGEKQAAAAIKELVKLGALTRAGDGVYRPANAPPSAELPSPALTCRWCHELLPPGRRMFCSDQCAARSAQKQFRVRKREARGVPEPLLCVVCGTRIPRKAKNDHQLYCSRKCQRVVERQKYLERDIAAGTAGSCKTCGKPIRADVQNWCSQECRPRSRGGLHPDDPDPT
jgi:predicted nucleic acid-binding Zn ribbon protein